MPATYIPAKLSTQFVFYASLVSQANTKLMQVNPTIASGDFKVSIDGGALANLATLPAVTPAGSSIVKFTLSTSEMAGANATVVCLDAAGAEWCDLTINIPTATRQIDDLAYPATSGRSLAVDASGQTSVGALAASVITRASLAPDSGLQPIRSGTAQAGAATTITLDAGASAVNSIYADAWIVLTGGTGAGQVRRIANYVGATKVVTIGQVNGEQVNWNTTPDATTTFAILPAGWVSGSAAIPPVDVATVGFGAIDANAFATNAIDASALAADAVAEIVAAVFARVFSAAYGSFTFEQITELMVSALAAKCSGMATTTARFRNLADSADVIVATVDSVGNRTAVTRTP